MLVKKWSEALVLYERVLKYAKEVQSKAKSLNNSLKVGIKCKRTHTHTPQTRVMALLIVEASFQSLIFI